MRVFGVRVATGSTRQYVDSHEQEKRTPRFPAAVGGLVDYPKVNKFDHQILRMAGPTSPAHIAAKCLHDRMKKELIGSAFEP